MLLILPMGITIATRPSRILDKEYNKDAFKQQMVFADCRLLARESALHLRTYTTYVHYGYAIQMAGKTG